MKCGDCGRYIDPRRGYCTFWTCHNKAIGGPTPEPLKQRARSRGDAKRCPFCTGERNGLGTCFIAACDRGPGGRSCGCHYMMAGMGNPGQEMRERIRVTNAHAKATLQARHLDLDAGGGARLLC